MSKTVTCLGFFMALLFIAGASGADTFKCTRPDGSVFYTNDPSQVPKGCAIERIQEIPPIGVIPDPQPAVSAPDKPVRPPTQAEKGKPFVVFSRETEMLVGEFLDARQRAVRSTLVVDKLQARRELADIRARAGALRNEISQSPLSTEEKQTLENQLTTITE